MASAARTPACTPTARSRSARPRSGWPRSPTRSTRWCRRRGDDLEQWLGSFDVSPTGGGESLEAVDRRVRRTRDRLIAAYPGKTVLAVTHVTPITVLVRLALGAPMESLFRLQLAPASVTVVSWYPEGQSTLRMFNARPTEAAFLGR